MPDAPAPRTVLARKHRPIRLSEVVGQPVLTRTLANAITSGRIAHAYLLTGIRGTGKTSTARILARCLNCESGPTAEPCGTCAQCRAIATERHVDVVEMDAASHTGVEDIRGLIEGVGYAPVQGRWKVYIIDEIHMLSKNAFNALLKTLEEPPARVLFVFATTEARKVPATVISRCQRFDLRRVEERDLATHLGRVCAAEGFRVEPRGLELLARAADGSVRDSLTLLDQAAAIGAGAVTEEGVRRMLGLGDRVAAVEMADAALGGDAPRALAALRRLVSGGADPAIVLSDMLDYAHFVCVAAAVPAETEDPVLPEAERRLGAARAKGIGVRAAHEAWQGLLKGFEDVQAAPDPLQAVEMAVLRVAAGGRA